MSNTLVEHDARILLWNVLPSFVDMLALLSARCLPDYLLVSECSAQHRNPLARRDHLTVVQSLVKQGANFVHTNPWVEHAVNTYRTEDHTCWAQHRPPIILPNISLQQPVTEVELMCACLIMTDHHADIILLAQLRGNTPELLHHKSQQDMLI